MLKYIFAAIFIALAWAAVLVWRDVLPMWPAIVVTVAIVVGLAIYAIVRMLLVKRAASAIEAGLRDQAARQNEGVRPDLQAEIAAMQSQFTKAVATLKASKLGRQSRDALGILPWYVMIGPSGSGKTTAIKTSGLKFPQGRAGAVRGVGGTRNCDWWMTNEAILLDTAGRWSTDDDDRDEWLAFLDLMKKTRPQKPINGIILAVPAADPTGARAGQSLQANEEDILELASKLRERIDEVTGRLDMVVPVYLVVTKCDLVSGFVETFGDLKDKERGQIWGFSLPLARDGVDDVEAFEHNFGELGGVLERHCLLRLPQERRIEARQRIFGFSQGFSALGRNLATLVEHLFAANAYQDSPIMRGVYFTSGTQEGRPVDRMMEKMAEAFGVRPRLESPIPAKPKSYFLRDVFRRVVFPDRDVAVRSTRVLRAERRVRWAGTAAALLVASTLLFLPISSYLENRRFVSECALFLERLAHAREQHAAGSPLVAAPLESAGTMAARLAGFAQNGRPDVSLRFGLYPGERLMTPLRNGVEILMVRPILDADAKHLLDWSGHARGDDDAASALAGLMGHLLLTQPKAADEPAPENEEWGSRWVPLAARTVADRYAALGNGTATTKSRRTVEDTIAFYGLGFDASADLLERRGEMVGRVRSTLLGANDGDALSEMLRDPDLPRDVRLVDIVGGAVTVFQTGADPRGGPAVAGAFTPEGWKVIKARIERRATDWEHDENAWVLGAARKRTRIDKRAVQSAYFRRYIDAWKAFLLSLSVKEPTSLQEARSLIKTLVIEKPLDAIWRNASTDLVFEDEQSLVDQAAGKLRAAVDKKEAGVKDKTGLKGLPAVGLGGRRGSDEPPGPADVGREFGAFLSFGLTKPTGLETYGQSLAEIAGALGEPGATPDAKAFESAIKAQRVKLSTLVASYNQNGWEAGMLEKILMPPLRGAEVAVGGATLDSANRKWCENIVVVSDQLLAGKYPFAAGRHARDAQIGDVEKFFMPKGGALWQYYDENLAADIEHPAGTSLYRPKETATVKYKPALFGFLKRARELTDLLFRKDPSKLGITVGVRIRASAPFTKIVFESGGRKVSYINARERWEDLVWPAGGALFRFFEKSGEGELGYMEGDWALFHLIEDGRLTVTSEGDEYLSGAWTPPIGEGVIRADFRPVGLLRGFKGLEVPRGIVLGAAGCGR